MTRLRILAGTGIVLAVLTACANGQSTDNQPQQPPGNEQTRPPDGQSGITPPEGATPLPADRVDASAMGEGFPASVWTVGDGKTVGLVGQEGGCGKASAEVAEQSDARVVVKVVETQPAKQMECTMDLRYPKLSVELAQPLGERKVVLNSEQRNG